MRYFFALLITLTTFTTASAETDFFTFDNGLRDRTLPTFDDQIKLLAELDYDGIGPTGLKGLSEKIKVLDRHKIKLSSLYVKLEVDKEVATPDPALEEAIKMIEGRDTIILLFCNHGKTRPADGEADEALVKRLKQLGDVAKKHKVKLSIYPHIKMYIETTAQAKRVVDKVDHPNVGLTFNLCHELKMLGPDGIKETLTKSIDRLFCVVINGADRDGTDWSTLIQPLGEGTFDNAEMITWLKQLGYTGPFGLQCYNVRGPSKEKLGRSIKAWKEIQSKLKL